MPPPAPGKMVVTSVCLEDVHPDAGPLFYIPGSQKIPPYRFSNGTIRAIPAEMGPCHAYIDNAIKERGLKSEIFLGRKGDCFIWSCQIAHGGSPIRRSEAHAQEPGDALLARQRHGARTSSKASTAAITSPRTTSRSRRTRSGSGLPIARCSKRAGRGGL